MCADVTVRTARRLTIDAERGEAALLEAAHGRFAAYCAEHGGEAAPCMLSVRSTIPPEVGLAGSSAIVVAALRALGSFNSVQIPKAVLPTVALAAEEDLGIPAGLQDRVAQVYEGLVYMDFDPEHLALRGHGRYERLDSNLLEHAYVAWSPRAKVSSATFHGELRRRFRSGDADVIAALAELGELVNAARTCLRGGDSAGLDAIINANFDLRRRLGPLDPTHVRMVEVARAAGASANYAGSGGSITGLVVGANRFAELKCALAGLGCTVIRPTIVG